MLLKRFARCLTPRLIRQRDVRLDVKRFVIFGRGRSGSTLLVDLLKSHSDVQCEGELLRRWRLFPERYLIAKMAETRTPVWGFKLLTYHLELIQALAPCPFLQWLCRQDFRVVYLKRRNLVRHALSNVYARANTFHSRGADKARRPIRVQREELFRWLGSSVRFEHAEQVALSGIDFLSVVYEDDLERGSNWQATANRCFGFLGLPEHEVTTDLRKVAPSSLSEMVENYEDMVEWLRQSPYEKYLAPD